MKRYSVFIEPEAEEEILESYEWGVSHWGQELVEKWIRDLYSKIFTLLAISPTGCAIAPDAEIAAKEIRHMFAGRYRVLFEIKGKHVFVLHVRGPFTGRNDRIQ